MEHKQYWNQDKSESNVQLELRSSIALNLIERFGSVAGTSDGEDSHGRAKMSLQSPHDLVNRCFAIADCFVDISESRGEMREPESFEIRHSHLGRARKIQMDAEFKRDEVSK